MGKYPVSPSPPDLLSTYVTRTYTSYWLLYKLPCESSLMHYRLKLDLCSIWKESLHNSCTGAAMLPSGAHSVHLHGCWSQPLACCSEHSPIVQNTSNFKPVAACQRRQAVVEEWEELHINQSLQPGYQGIFFWGGLFFFVWLLWSQPRPVFHICIEGSLEFCFTVHLSGIKYGSHTCQPV